LTVAGYDLTLRPLTRADFPLVVEWLARDHVAEWWGPPSAIEAVEEKYGPSVDGTDPTLLFICHVGGVPVGLLQIYRLDDNPEYAEAVGLSEAGGIDLFIGEAGHCGSGLGPRIIAAAAGLIWERYPESVGAMAGPSVRNARSVRAFEKAGFRALRQAAVPGEDDEELILYLERPRGV
jgi:aminoglycoside 6'-N-acetyltransferase